MSDSHTPITLPHLDFPEQLPVSMRRNDIADALAAHQVLIVCGETGSGKTTQLPKIALAAGRGSQGMIGMTQPRRIAAKSVAQRIAEETRSRLGALVGWQVRFTDQVTADTRIKVMTDGILLAETQSDPQFRTYDTLILDEAHERNLNIDFLLGYLKTLLPKRPDLKLIISSATLEADRFSAYFSAAPVIEVSGRTYPVETRYRPPAEKTKAEVSSGKRDKSEDEPDFDTALLHAVDELAADGPGDILVFLPGEREIRETQEALRKHHPPHTEILPLFARLSVSEQERIFQAHSGRRIVLATNVAETSLTVPGIRYVVDTGQARVKRYSIRNKIEQLKIEKVSQASANQRAGRCGRVAEGICIRLYDEQDFQSRPKYTTPELLRSSLAGVILRMKALNLPDVSVFPFLDPPEAKRIRDGQNLLAELGALDDGQRLTPIGRQLARLPLDPRIGRMLIAARDKGCLYEALAIAAYLSVQDPRDRPLEQQTAADQKHRRFADASSDFIAILKIWHYVDDLNTHRKSHNKFREALRADFISPLRVREWRDVFGQLSVQVKELGWKVGAALPIARQGPDVQTDPAHYANLHQALLPGLLGNLGMLTEEGLYLGARETKFLIFPGSGVKKKPKWVMAAEIVETRRVYGRGVARIEPEWIEQAARHLLKISYSDPHWAKRPAQVTATMRATLYGLPVVNGRQVHYGPIDPKLSRELFIRGALVNGDYVCRAPFFNHNRQLLDEIDDLSHRSRDARMAVDEQALYDFFEARLPQHIHTGAAFEKWRREVEKKDHRLLFLERSDLLGGTAAAGNAFPTHLDLGETRFELSYRFDPGSEDDGVTLLIPLAALNQVDSRACDWLVPGLLEEKIAALIKSLPQSIRRAFVPVPDFARSATQALEPSSDALIDRLAGFLQKTTGQTVPSDAWRPEALANHLHMNYRVLDDRGHILAESRKLAELRQQFGGKAQTLVRNAAVAHERGNVTSWDFGDLPESIEVTAGNRPVAAFPALVEVAGQVALKLFDRLEAALETHRRGVCRLLWLQQPARLKQAEKDLASRLKSACLHYGLLHKGLGCPDLIRDILFAAARNMLDTEPAQIRTAAAFTIIQAQSIGKIANSLSDMANIAERCLPLAQEITQLLEHAPASWKNAVDDMRKQLDDLMPADFMARHPPAMLIHLPRYLKAMHLRLDKLAANPTRDQQSQRDMAGLKEVYLQRQKRNNEQHRNEMELDTFRWQLEELRVALFAQELKTPTPISVKRLEKAWATTFA